MPTLEHEMPLELIRNRPELAPELLRSSCGVKLPEDAKISLGSESLNDVKPKELRCDATVLVGDPSTPDLGIVVEVQLEPKEEKRYSWPAYLAVLRARHRCPVMLLVLCPTARAAAKCAEPIDLGPEGGPSWVLTPLTLGPDRLPVVTDPEQARRLPELAVLSVLAHADGPERTRILEAYCAALDATDDGAAFQYHHYVVPRLSEAATARLEEIVETGTYEFKDAFSRKYIAIGKAEGEAEGEAKGEAKAVMRVLETRGLEVSEQVRERVMACTDLRLLETWIDRAVVVGTAEEIFG